MVVVVITATTNAKKSMKSPKLTEEEQEVYDQIRKTGSMQEMFLFGYILGRERIAREQIKMFEELKSK